MKKILLLIFGLCVWSFTNAQNFSVNILQKTIDKVYSLKSLDYEIYEVQKNPFSTGDTSFRKTKASLVFDDKGVMKTMDEKTNTNNGQHVYERIYANNTLYSIRPDSTYSIDKISKKGAVNSDLGSFIDLIKKCLIKYSSKIIQHKDTVVGNISCYNFFIKTYDTIENNNHNYNYNFLSINKVTLMPVYIKQESAGIAEKDGHVIGRLNFFSEQYFSNFEFNKKINNTAFFFNKSHFELENDKMLPNGAIAPELRLKDLDGREVPFAKFKNKILLVEFGATTCPANPLANPMLNRLNKKYDTRDFAIVSIYSNETPDQIKKYIESNKLQFLLYIGNKKINRDFKTMGTPGFYLIDKSGKILQSSNGYSDDLEKELIKKIDQAI